MSPRAMAVMSGLLSLHLAGFAAWGGLLLAYLVLHVRDSATSGRLLHAMLVAIIITLAAGWVLAFADYGSPGDWPWSTNAMQALGIAMATIVLVARFGALMLFEDAETQKDHDAIEAASRRIQRLVAMALLLSVVTLVIAVSGRYG